MRPKRAARQIRNFADLIRRLSCTRMCRTPRGQSIWIARRLAGAQPNRSQRAITRNLRITPPILFQYRTPIYVRLSELPQLSYSLFSDNGGRRSVQTIGNLRLI